MEWYQKSYLSLPGKSTSVFPVADHRMTIQLDWAKGKFHKMEQRMMFRMDWMENQEARDKISPGDRA